MEYVSKMKIISHQVTVVTPDCMDELIVGTSCRAGHRNCREGCSMLVAITIFLACITPHLHLCSP